MSTDIGQPVDTNSTEFKQGVDAGLNSSEDTKNWQAGNELGQELKDERENKEPVTKSLPKESSTPLFMRAGSGGSMGSAQDEKDETVE